MSMGPHNNTPLLNEIDPQGILEDQASVYSTS